MIKHCVWVRFRPEITRQERDALMAEVSAMQGIVPGLLALRSGVNARFEDLDHGFNEGFIAEFSDEAALQAYQKHPLHQAAGRKLVAAAQGGVQGILVFDLLVE